MKFLEYIVEENTHEHKQFLSLAYNYAHMHSQDFSTHVGSCLVHKLSNSVALGTNRIPEQFNSTISPGELTRENKNQYLKHSEYFSILEAKLKNIPIKESTLYLNWFPCYDCAELITQNKIPKLVFHADMIFKTPLDWESSLEKAYQHLVNEGVQLAYYKGKLGVLARIREEDWIA